MTDNLNALARLAGFGSSDDPLVAALLESRLRQKREKFGGVCQEDFDSLEKLVSQASIYASWSPDEAAAESRRRSQPALFTFLTAGDAKERLGPNLDGLLRLKAQVESHPAFLWLRGNRFYIELEDSLARKALREERYSDPQAFFKMLEAVAAALGLYRHYIENGKKPRKASKEAKQKALEAVQALISCYEEGVSFYPHLKNAAELRELESKISHSIDTHKNPYGDEHASPRQALTTFGYQLYFRFHQVPAVFMDKMANLLEYGGNVNRIRKEIIAYLTQKGLPIE